MDPLSARFLEALPLYGPWLLFAMAVLETCFITGLVVPSGVATSLGTVLALEGRLALPWVVAAALAGGAVGDSLGFWIGRRAGQRVLTGEGRAARAIARRHATVSRWFGRHPFYSVTVARVVSFVRTVMPVAAGMSALAYPRYLAYELVGLVLWAALYVAIGALAREGWVAATQVVGVGSAVLFVGVGAAVWLAMRVRRRRRARAWAPADGSDAGPHAADAREGAE